MQTKETRDGGYYPAKHDNFVFSQAASNFSITTESVSQIYQEYSKVAAELEVNEINKLPIYIRKKTMMRKMQNILLNNHDLPFFSIEGPPTDEMPSVAPDEPAQPERAGYGLRPLTIPRTFLTGSTDPKGPVVFLARMREKRA